MPPALIQPVLTLDAALDGCSAGVIAGQALIAHATHPGGRGSAAILPALAQQVLSRAGIAPTSLAAIAVTIGPGSFTGVRAALALAHGIALAAGIPIRGASLGDAIRADAALATARPVWVAIDSKRGRVFLDDGRAIATTALDALPMPGHPIALAGDAAAAVATRLAARGADVQLLRCQAPTPQGIAAAAHRDAQPLYIDPPEARPGPPVRPAPV